MYILCSTAVFLRSARSASLSKSNRRHIQRIAFRRLSARNRCRKYGKIRRFHTDGNFRDTARNRRRSSIALRDRISACIRFPQPQTRRNTLHTFRCPNPNTLLRLCRLSARSNCPISRNIWRSPNSRPRFKRRSSEIYPRTVCNHCRPNKIPHRIVSEGNRPSLRTA